MGGRGRRRRCPGGWFFAVDGLGPTISRVVDDIRFLTGRRGDLRSVDTPRALISDRDAGLFVHRVGELAAAAEPVRGRCGERTREDTVEACQVRAEGGELRWLQRSGVRTINRRRTGEQVYGGKRQRVLIGTPVNVGPRRQFGRRIAGLAGNSEVGQQDPLVASTLTG
ncbi:Uncharacterised protein [Mycobacterium tuberculosis]|uniref:Uncharacterized protein n=1 Tax=Mycobacterium tuberculosis TaxID=1773 RepID=A0A654TN75_MYCTX|nr:Uncharacterised protein [Mycobacterium tuberculosis]CFR76615.1 Uncharacterised protein [Mycobacterium tuberculosis]CKT13789.1 Uncharacterised protein [Mycobacterium tuberculosis]CKV34436.1 Uncharacterised protein [Mycobacterium tuberculosis]COW09720.1 Uncharacterised protein [Mycobacterium tuberculosis]